MPKLNVCTPADTDKEQVSIPLDNPGADAVGTELRTLLVEFDVVELSTLAAPE
jgi:hypothetical protein